MNLIAEYSLIKKELITNLRSRKPFIFLLVSYVFYAFFLMTLWPSDESSLYRVSYRISESFQSIVVCLFLLSNLFLPGMSAASFTSEKEQGTYELLKGTLITPWKFVLAKLIVILFYLLVLFASLLPILASCLLGGGINGSQIIRVFFCIFVTGMLTTLFGFYASLTSKTTSDAVKRAYGFAFLAVGGLALTGHFCLLFCSFLFSEILGISSYNAFSGAHEVWSVLTNPWVILFDVFQPFLSAWGTWLPPQVTNTTVYLVWSAIILILIFRRVVQEEQFQLKRDNKKTSKKSEKRFSTFRSISPVLAFVLRKSRNAIAQKEIYTQMAVRYRHQKIMAILGMILLFGFNLLCLGSRIPPYIAVNLQLFLIGVLLTGRAASVISRDIENEEFDLIRSTLITPNQFILGKFQAVFYSVLTPLLLCILFNYMFIFSETRRYNYDFNIFRNFYLITLCNVEIILVTLTVLMISLMSSVLARKTSASTVLAYFLNFLFYGGFLIFVAMLNVRFRENDVALFSPLIAVPYLYESNSSSIGFMPFHFGYIGVVFIVSFILSNIVMSEKRWIDA